LIVSSSSEDRLALASALEGHPCPQHWATSLQESLDQIERTPPRVVICDANLPDGSWRDLWDHLRFPPDPPVFLVMETNADERLWAEVLNVGGYDVLVKPFDVFEVFQVVQQACHTSSAPH